MRMRTLILAAAVLATAVGCDGTSGEAHPDSLVGTVTLDGTVVPSESLIVTGPNGEVAGGSTNDAGEYLIPDPPKGQLKVQFMPPVRGNRNKPMIPIKYTKPGNDLGIEYTGGKHTYDIELKS